MGAYIQECRNCREWVEVGDNCICNKCAERRVKRSMEVCYSCYISLCYECERIKPQLNNNGVCKDCVLPDSYCIGCGIEEHLNTQQDLCHDCSELAAKNICLKCGTEDSLLDRQGYCLHCGNQSYNECQKCKTNIIYSQSGRLCKNCRNK